MKRTIIFIAILLAAVGLVILIVLNRPANILMRKGFTALTGMMMVSENEYNYAIGKNETLQLQVESLENDVDDLQKTNESLRGDIKQYQYDFKLLESNFQETEKKLAATKLEYQQLSVTDQLVLFDAKTKGTRPSGQLDDDKVVTDPERIADAIWKMHKGDVCADQLMTQARMLNSQRSEIKALESINANLIDINDNLRAQLVLKDQQIQNLIDARDDVMKKARIRTIIMILVAAAGYIL